MSQNCFTKYVPKTKEELKKLIEKDIPGKKIDVSNIKDMSELFKDNKKYNHPLEGWDVSNVTNMSHMFYDCKYNHPLEKWDVSNVTNTSKMFEKSKINYKKVNGKLIKVN